MIHGHCSTASQRAHWVSELLAQEGRYGVVSQISRSHDISRQMLYTWKGKGQAALEGVLVGKHEPAESDQQLERAILTLLVEGHASYRGIQRCVWVLLGGHVSVGKIAAVLQSAGQRAQKWMSHHVPATTRELALDELYGSTHGEAYLNVVDVHSGAVWASTSAVGVDGESWLVLWDLEEHGLPWDATVSDGGRAIEEAVGTVTPQQPHQRDVWHVLHACQQVQARLERQVAELQQRTPVVARQAARLAAGKRPRGICPKTDVAAQVAGVAQATYTCEGLCYLSGELRHLLGVVVLTPQGIHTQHDSARGTGSAAGTRLPHTGAKGSASAGLGMAATSHPGPDSQGAAGQSACRLAVGRRPLLTAWEAAVRASSAVENWHSILRPYLAVHRSLSSGMVALLAVWHNHRIAHRGLHRGQSPLMRSGMTQASSDWLVDLGYPPDEGACLPASLGDAQSTPALAA